MAKEYKVEYVTESGCGTLFAGSAALPIQKIEAVLNEYGAQGWSFDFMVIESRRYLIFWQREAVIITMSREV